MISVSIHKVGVYVVLNGLDGRKRIKNRTSDSIEDFILILFEILVKYVYIQIICFQKILNNFVELMLQVI